MGSLLSQNITFCKCKIVHKRAPSFLQSYAPLGRTHLQYTHVRLPGEFGGRSAAGEVQPPGRGGGEHGETVPVVLLQGGVVVGGTGERDAASYPDPPAQRPAVTPGAQGQVGRRRARRQLRHISLYVCMYIRLYMCIYTAIYVRIYGYICIYIRPAH